MASNVMASLNHPEKTVQLTYAGKKTAAKKFETIITFISGLPLG